jgi:hypothetical protein
VNRSSVTANGRWICRAALIPAFSRLREKESLSYAAAFYDESG